MIDNKFQRMFIVRLKETIEQWTVLREITEKELYLFLHNMKGMAGAIDLQEIEAISTKKLEEVNPTSETIWHYEEWYSFLEEILSIINIEKGSELSRSQEELSLVWKEQREELILIIDDDYDIITSTKSLLEENGYSVAIAITADKGLSQFYELKPSLVIMGMNLPDRIGFELLPQLVEKTKIEFTPIIVISSEDDEESYIQSYNAGASDFISKSLNKDVFISLVHNRCRRRNEIQQSIILDELTGAFNCKFLKMELDRQIYEFSRSNYPFSLAMVDLDFFKTINDQYGHLVGDEVLKGFVDIINKSKRATDFVMRYAGEEFAILLPKTNLKQAESVMKRFLKEFSSYMFTTNEGQEFQVTFSAGIVQISDDIKDKEELLNYAVMAMNAAKEQGRSQIYIYKDNSIANTIKKKIQLIVIDDEKMNREILLKQLSNLQIGEHVLEVQTYSDGFMFLQSSWYNPNEKYIILLDGLMPKMDGMEVLSKLRKNYSDKNILVLMLTPRKGEKEIISALELGADDFMSKPFKMGELVARIRRLKNRIWV